MPNLFDTDSIVSELAPFVEAGFAIHWLHPKTKRPIGDDWSDKPVASLNTLRRRHQPGNNVGVRLGEPSRLRSGNYLHVFDIDIRIADKAGDAWAKLRAILGKIDPDSLPMVISGSGGESRHLYFVTDRPFGSKKLAHSGEKFTDTKGKQHWTWEIELFGTGKQVAAPPSIHPDTGLAYVWGREFDLAMASFGVEPFIKSELLVGVAPDLAKKADDAEVQPPLGLTADEAREILADLPLDEWCEDRDGWLRAGMALHHEFGDDGFLIWDEFSQRSEKYNGEDQQRVWDSFRLKTNSIRMASLKQAARTARIMADFEEVDDFDEGDAQPAPKQPETRAKADVPGDAEEEYDLDALLGTPADAAEKAEDDEYGDMLGTPSTDAAAPGSSADWVSLLALDDKGAIKTCLHNVELILTNDPRTRSLAQLNEFTQETVQRRDPGKKSQRAKATKETRQLTGRVWSVEDRVNGDLWSDDRDFAIRSVMEAPKTQGGYGIKLTDRDLKAAVTLAANRSPFHPVREYLESQVWDGTPRAERLFIDYVGATDNEYTRTIARLMLIGAVTRIFEPGHKFDFAVILEGLQGKGKSTFIETLGAHWSAELDGDFHDHKQMVELMQGAWIMEIPELSGFTRADVRSIKAFISRRKDRVRLAYARRAGQFPRQCIFIGSTNDQEYLKDDTGGRRFWPVECHASEIDIAGLRANINQIWAEALAMYRAMRAEQPVGTLPLFIRDVATRRHAETLQEMRRVESSDDALIGRITDWLDRPVATDDFDDEDPGVLRDRTCLIEIWTSCLGNDIRSYKSAEAQMMGRVMRRMPGWTISSERERPYFEKYGRQRAYVRG